QRRYDNKIVFHNKLETEEAPDVRGIKNLHFRAVLEHVGIKTGIDVVSFTDTPLASGLGSSGAFIVGLLNALWSLRGAKKTPRELAEEAAHVEINKLKAPIGKHDQYLAAYGGICALSFLRNGTVRVKKFALTDKEKKELADSFLLVYSGMAGPTAVTLSPLSQKLRQMEPHVVTAMHTFRDMNNQLMNLVSQRNLLSYGEKLHYLWEHEKKTFLNSNERLDALIDIGKKHGAKSALVVGAGGGGFLYFVCPNQKIKVKISKAVTSMGASEYPFSFTEEGSKIIFSA
ncbi:MAG: hypothetical protein AAB846_00055, partial [Patescibacteria group bacterium]